MIGNLIGGCRLVEAIGQGAFGTVYKAVQVSLERLVAVKILHGKTPDGIDSPQAFTSEARLAARLNHTNIVRVYDHGCDSGVYYTVMEFVQGETLDRVMASRGTLPLEEALAIAGQIASALDCAHRQGVVHSDLNPCNVIIASDRRTVVSDFFGWRMGERAGRDLVGVPEYVSPEQARGLMPTPKSDIYSLGIILYEMLVGRPPFSEEASSDTLFKQISSDPTPPIKLRAEIPVSLDATIMRMLAKNPDVRQESCGVVASEIEAIKAELRGGSHGKQTGGERRRVSPALVGTLIPLLAAIAGIGYLVQQSVANDRRLERLAARPLARAAPEAVLVLSRSVANRYKKELVRGQALASRGDYRAAADAFHAAAQMRPSAVDPHLFLASVFIERQDYVRARQELDAVLRLDPGNQQARVALASLRAHPGRR